MVLKEIFESTYLEEIGAYNYLIFLKNNPGRALEKLKAGFPNVYKKLRFKEPSIHMTWFFFCFLFFHTY